MMNTPFEEKDLPLADLQKLGLYKDGKLGIGKDDLDALLTGRRTDLISIKDLRTDAFHIQQLDTKLSLQRYADGSVSLNLHPIYKKEAVHNLLEKEEAEKLISGKMDNVFKQVPLENGRKKELIIEYDAQTREFLTYEMSRVQVPETVNGQQLSPVDKPRYRQGEVVELADGTRLQHRASERKGLLSDRQALILSVLLDGGISYLLITGIRNLIQNREAQKEHNTPGYQKALKEMQDSQRIRVQKQDTPEYLHLNDHKNDYSRGYGRGASR